MDSHVFRLLAGELIRLLSGARLEKIYSPFPGVHSFTLFAHGTKRHLILRHERQHPLLFFTERRMSNPERPSGLVMRLRKYCGGKRLGSGTADFSSRCLAFPVAVPARQEGHSEELPATTAGTWFVLDLRTGPQITFSLPGNFGAEPLWPEAMLVDSLCDKPWNKREMQGAWREYAVLTPFLRENLAGLSPLEGRALLVDLEAGGGDIFAYADASGRPLLYSAWPLTDEACLRRGLAVCSVSSILDGNGDATFDEAFPVLSLVSRVDEARFFDELGTLIRQEEERPERKENKKLTRLLETLRQEELRMKALAALHADACALQEVLWRYPAKELVEAATVPDAGGGERTLSLEPLLTVRENMARMFHSAARGTRGLEHVRQRRVVIEAALSGEPQGQDGAVGPVSLAAAPHASSGSRKKNSVRDAEKNVARFLSTDGHTLLRGKNAEGNRELLKLGQGHDLWLHAVDGPSAHVIIQRAHPAEEIPETTLREAAVLVGEKSRQRNEGRVDVMIAQLRHVHAIKGAAPGTVRVDTVLRTFSVPLST